MRRFNRPDGGEPPLPKPYAFVPIPETRARLERPVGHDTYDDRLLTGTIAGTLVALSPVHVASGNIELTGGQPSLVKAHFRRNDRPTIPGSSLKGAIRSIVEAISDPPSCLRVTRARPAGVPANVARCTKKESLCVACRMFGAMGYFGRVRFSDAILEHGETEVIQIPVLHQPGKREPERVYFDRGKVKGRKFYMHGQGGQTARGNVPVEACPTKSRFQLETHFDNLRRDELALLLTALGQGEAKLTLKLGGGKPACCGSVEVTNVVLKTVPARASSTEFDVEPQLEDIQAIVSAAHTINLDRLAEILKYPGERACPEGTY